MSEVSRPIIVSRGGKLYGPYTQEETIRYFSNGALLLGDQARLEGDAHWSDLATILGISEPPPPALPQRRQRTKGAFLVILAVVCVLIFFGLIAGTRSPERTVRSFLEAAMTHRDASEFLAPGVDAGRVTNYEVTSFELNNTAGDVVSVTVHFQGRQYYHKPQFNTAGGYSGDLTVGAEEIDMPQQIRFRVGDGKIVEVF